MAKNILTFHSYLSGPCLDGLVSSLLVVIYGDSVRALVPHRRTPDMNVIFAEVLDQSCDGDSLVYLDIGPVSEEELSAINVKIGNESINIVDHHELDMGMENLKSKNINVEVDYDLCVAAQVLDKIQDIPRKFETLIDFIQFTEYEGTNEIHQRQERVQKHCMKNFTCLTSSYKISSIIYAIIDELLSTTNGWESLMPFKMFNNSSELAHFKTESMTYLEFLLDIVNGKVNLDNITSRLDAQMKLSGIPKKFSVIPLPMSVGNTENIFCTEIDIRKFGRSLEPIVRTWMQQLSCHYAILINPMKDDVIYVSLRRSCDLYNAKDVAKVLGEISGSKKYGGHPWGAGVTMTMLQYKKLLQTLNLQQFGIEN